MMHYAISQTSNPIKSRMRLLTREIGWSVWKGLPDMVTPKRIFVFAAENARPESEAKFRDNAAWRNGLGLRPK